MTNSSLTRHIPELALDWALDTPDRRHRAIEGTLCFADISGFTALAERLAQRGRAGGEELVETLSRVFGSMLDLARQRGGGLLKFGGDALLLFFEGEGHALRAAAAAVEMQRALRKAAKTRTSVGPLRLSMSVGLHAGAVDFFLVGGAHRELVVLGPAATQVVATEGAANAGEIAVSAATAALLPEGAATPREDGELLLRWRTAPRVGFTRPERSLDDATVRALFPRRLGEMLSRGAPEPEHRVACIAFLRFSGTDAMLANEGPEAVARALDATLDVIQRCFDAEGVTLLAVDVDRDGGKVFAASGAPTASEDDEGAMLRALRAIFAARPPLPLQMGVNRGHVFAAELGTARRAAYSAMGDTTNTAARIAAKTPPGAIYAHPAVLDYSLTLFDVAPAGPFAFKGKKAPLLVYAVGEERGTRSREGIAAFSFVGRDAERAVLEDALASLARGHGGVVSIVGASGVGKSRLLAEALARTAPPAQISLRAEPYGAANPYRVFRDPVRELLGVVRGEAGAMRAALEQAVARLDPELLPSLSLIGDVAHVEIPASPEVASLDPRFRPERTADAVVRLFAAARPGPLAIVVEDAHWADDASAQLLGRIARECSERSWLLAVARRDVDGGFTPVASAATLSLAPLSDAAIEALLIAASEAAPLRPHELEQLVKRASGNPLFALESLRASREAGSLEAVPDTLEAAIAAQVDALDAEPRRLVRHASVLGRSFRRDLLAELLGVDREILTAAVVAQLDAFLEADGEERLRFRNGVVRDTLYSGLAYRQRARLHRAAGEALERGTDDPVAMADTLALHFARAGEHAKSWRYARSAAERARKAFANADAVRLYELALEGAKSMRDVPREELVLTWRELGDVRELAGLFEPSLDAYQRAVALAADRPNLRADLLLGRARAKERMGNFPAALRDLARGRRLISGDVSEEAAKTRARLFSFAAMVNFLRDKPALALAVAQDAEAEARQANERLALGRALEVRDLAKIGLGEPTDGADMREALGIFVEIGDLAMEATVRLNLGGLSMLRGRWEEAVEWLTTGREAHLRIGDAVGAAICALNLGETLINQGRCDEAHPVLDQARRVMRASQFSEGAAPVELQLARILVERGQLDQADELLERVGADLRRLGKLTTALEASTLQAFVRVGRGEAAEALALLERAVALAGGQAGFAGPRVAFTRAAALLDLSRIEDAAREVASGLRDAAAQNLPYERALLLRLAGVVAERAGRAQDSAELSEAEAIFRQLGVVRPPMLSALAQRPPKVGSPRR